MVVAEVEPDSASEVPELPAVSPPKAGVSWHIRP